MPTFRVQHRTAYTYDAPVSASYGQLWQIPGDVPGQTCHEVRIDIDPVPGDRRAHTDIHGNTSTFFEIHTPHTELTITATSRVTVDRRRAELALDSERSWQEVRDVLTGAANDVGTEAAYYRLDSPQATVDDRVRDYAAASFASDRSYVDALADLSSRIHADFDFEAGVTSVTSTADELFEHGAGVCQDFAHLGIACVRSVGLPARYVSGYLETDPPPGTPKLTGVDVSHAWLSVLLPDGSWVDVDPTNDQFVNDRYVTTGWGRDYTDVPPAKGVIFTDATSSTLEVTVDVLRAG